MLASTQPPGLPPSARLFVIVRGIHVSQDQFAGFDLAPLGRINKVQAKPLDGVRDFPDASCQRRLDRLSAFAMVHGGQGFDSSLGSGNDGIGVRSQRTRNQPVEPFLGKIGEIAGDDQVPTHVRRRQSGGDSRKRPKRAFARFAPSLSVSVRDCAQSERGVSRRGSDNCDLRDEWCQQSGRVHNQWYAAEIEELFIAPHARAGAPCKNEPCDLAMTLHGSPAILRPRRNVAQMPGGA